MKLFLLATAILFFSGCVSRYEPPVPSHDGKPVYCLSQDEPDTEWIVAQYAKDGEVSTNKRRLREGW